jgi:hypothetical protein
VPLVGAVEVAFGTGLLVGRFLAVVLAGVALQLLGTSLVPLLRPDVASVDGNPLLSAEGENVVKNLVLLAATATLALHTLSPDPTRPLLTGSRMPTIKPTAPQPRRRHDRRTCQRPRTRWRPPIRACLQRSSP